MRIPPFSRGQPHDFEVPVELVPRAGPLQPSGGPVAEAHLLFNIYLFGRWQHYHNPVKCCRTWSPPWERLLLDRL